MQEKWIQYSFGAFFCRQDRYAALCARIGASCSWGVSSEWNCWWHQSSTGWTWEFTSGRHCSLLSWKTAWRWTHLGILYWWLIHLGSWAQTAWRYEQIYFNSNLNNLAKLKFKAIYLKSIVTSLYLQNLLLTVWLIKIIMDLLSMQERFMVLWLEQER